ncbi:unnamed protein product [Rhizophagus irregularis]|nr:unnamed protein product [Rhizophagus irregularis]
MYVEQILQKYEIMYAAKICQHSCRLFIILSKGSIFSFRLRTDGRTKRLRLIIVFFFKSPEYNLAYRHSHYIITFNVILFKN